MPSNIVQELLGEASELAGTPQGFLRLIHLVTEEIEKIDFKNDPDAELQYANLLRLYVAIKRRLCSYRRQCKELDGAWSFDSLNQLRNAMHKKRNEAQAYAKKSLNEEKVKSIKLKVGRAISRKEFNVMECDA